ncbi:GntR family transcriptional regulator [Arthrobacter sp. B2a2-09]|uniref:GntR family transcriptional regulator n=1 Tax=Arthrobacter sp. B2a2-09 TaxID=2952822 RepID=UPI0022CD995F|nr:GntR family transcriptional regulator [Arthrobacter sp. B2a2-09]MCZ9880706.1 GntR family transcriptional regulator [Arthrobacter sp. B2a2-09]
MTVEFALDPQDSAPLYAQLYRDLRQRILDGDYAEGEAIPSETVLRDLHGITRSTVRHAVSLLVSEGLVRQIRGKGTIVSYTPINHSIWNFGGFTDFTRSLNERPVTEVLTQEIQDGPSGPQLKLVRARGVATDQHPTFLNLDTSVLDLRRFPGLEVFSFDKLSLYQVLREHYGVAPVRSELTLSVALPSELTRKVFGDLPDVPGFICASGEVYSSDDELVEHTSVVYSPALEMRVGTSWNGTIPGQAKPQRSV